MATMKSADEFKILLVYPNLSMLLAPPLCYAIFTNHFPKTHSGRANSALNVITFMLVFFI